MKFMFLAYCKVDVVYDLPINLRNSIKVAKKQRRCIDKLGFKICGASDTTSPLGIIKTKAMINDKGGHKFRKMGRRRLWMAPNSFLKKFIL